MPENENVEQDIVPTPSEEVSVVPLEEYEKVQESYENLRSFNNKRDKELHELREKVKGYEEKKALPIEEDEDEDAVLKERLSKLGYVPLQEVDEKVSKRIEIQKKAETMKDQIHESMKKYPFVKESDLLTFMSDRRISVEEALTLKYGQDISNFEANKQVDVLPETDAGGRTLSVQSTPFEDDRPVKRGIPTGMKFADFISRSIDKNTKDTTGN